jgi:plastocyanin
MTRPTLRRCAAVAVASLALLGACSDDDGNEAAAPDTTSAPEATEADPPSPVDCDGATGETVTVDIPDFEFAPTPVEVSACDEVVWSNSHNQAHTATSNGAFTFSTGNIAADGESEPVVFDATGSFTYICSLHPFMTGTVEVS